MILNDPKMLKRLRSGDREAYVQVAECYHKEIWAYVYRLCGDRETASDVCQETAVAVWRAAPEFMGVKALRSWIYRVAHNVYIDYCRKNRFKTQSLEEMDNDSLRYSKSDVANALITRDTVDRALSRLPENVREAVILTKVHGLTVVETSEILGAPAGTVKWWVMEGLKTLRKVITEDEEQRL